jgi:hypothetical protein
MSAALSLAFLLGPSTTIAASRAHKKPDQSVILAPRKASDVVTLTTTGTPCGTQGTAFDELDLPGGGTAPFSIPPGMVLVVTEIEVVVAGGGTGSGGITVLRTTGGSFGSFIAEAFVNLSNSPGATFTLPTGSVVASGTTICAEGSNFTTGGTPLTVGGTLHGFLAEDN